MSNRWLLLILFMTTGGCASIADCQYDFVQKTQARFAWGQAKRSIPAELNNRDYAKGYRDGYFDVSRGGNGVCPPVPPNCYWKQSLQDPDGLMRVQQWYLGFSHGSQDALNCCRNTWHEVPSVERAGVSPTLAWSREPFIVGYMSTQPGDELIAESPKEYVPPAESQLEIAPYHDFSIESQSSVALPLEEVTPVVQAQEPTLQ